MTNETIEKVLAFFKENYSWLIPFLGSVLIYLLYSIVKVRSVRQVQKGGQKSKLLQVGNDILINSKSVDSLKK
jgi:hypothetical protein